MSEKHDDAKKKIGSELLRDDSSLEEVVLAFVDGLKDRIAGMEAAVREGDFEALRTSAHQLKGSGGGYGYPALTDQAGTLERQAKSHAAGECLAAVDDLRKLCDRIVVEPAE